MTDVTAPRARGVLSLLRDRTFGPFYAGKLVSSCGIWVQNVAAAVLMFQLTRSAVMVGAVSMLQFAGPLLLALWSGALNDRRDRRRLLIAGRLLSGSAVAALTVALLLRGTDGFGGPPALLAAVFCMGVGLALSQPAMQALVPALVPAEDLEPALALSFSTGTVARTVGPALGAGLLVLGGPPLAFAAAATGHFWFVVMLLIVRPRAQARPRQRPNVLGGLQYLLRDRNAGKMMLGVALVSIGIDPVMTLTPSLADQLGGGSETVGLLASAFGVGAVLMVVAFNRARRLLSLRMAGFSGFWVVSVGLVGAAAGATVPTVAAGFFVAGAGFTMVTIALNTRIQRRVPDELRGRVMALWSLAFLGSRPFAALANGVVADGVSPDAALVVAATVVAASSFLSRVSYGDGSPNATGSASASASRAR